jgi:opacity protein-like surface antigen
MPCVKRFVLPVTVAIAMVAAGGTRAAAQQQPLPPPDPSLFMDDRAWTATPFVGLALGGNLETSPAFGGGAFRWKGRGFGFEAEIARVRSRQGVLTPFDVTSWTFMLNGTYGFYSTHNFTPYGLFGVGFQRVSADFSGIQVPAGVDDSATEFHGALGPASTPG